MNEALYRLLTRRADAIDVLCEEGATDKRTLMDRLAVSRSTVDRTVRDLESHRLARRTGGELHATLRGRLVRESLRRFREETDTICRHLDLLAELPPSVDLPDALLDGADAYDSTPPETGRPSNEIVDLFREGRRIRGCAKVINDPAGAEAFFRTVTELGGSGAFVYATGLADYFREEYFEMTCELASTGRYRAYETETLPYELFLVEGDGWTRVAVLVYDERETLVGALLNDTDAAVEWAEREFERRRRTATEFTDEFLVDDVSDADVTDDEPGDDESDDAPGSSDGG